MTTHIKKMWPHHHRGVHTHRLEESTCMLVHPSISCVRTKIIALSPHTALWLHIKTSPAIVRTTIPSILRIAMPRRYRSSGVLAHLRLCRFWRGDTASLPGLPGPDSLSEAPPYCREMPLFPTCARSSRRGEWAWGCLSFSLGRVQWLQILGF